MKPFPVQDLKILEAGYKELQDDLHFLEEEFQFILDEMNFETYDQKREEYEGYLERFIQIENDIKAYRKMLDKLKFEISN